MVFTDLMFRIRLILSGEKKREQRFACLVRMGGETGEDVGTGREPRGINDDATARER